MLRRFNEEELKNIKWLVEPVRPEENASNELKDCFRSSTREEPNHAIDFGGYRIQGT